MGLISNLYVKLGLKNKEFDQGIDKSEKKVSGFASSLKKMGGALAGAFAIGKVVTFFKESFRLYGIQEDAERKLRAQIEANGKAATSTLNDYKKFASGLQAVTTIGDEATLKMLQIAESMGATTKQSKEAAKGAIGLSKAFGISMETALRGVILAQKGQFEMLQRYIPTLRTANSDVEKAAILQKAMADSFKVAQAEVTVATGKLQQLSNAWGDFKEQLGKGIAQSPQFEAILGLLEGIVGKTGEWKFEQDKASEGAQRIFDSWKVGGKLTEGFLTKEIQLLKDQNKQIRANGGITQKGAKERINGNNALRALLREHLALIIKQGEEAKNSANKEIESVGSISAKITQLKSDKEALAKTDIKGIAIINDKIKAYEAEKKALDELSGAVIDKSATTTGITATGITDVSVSKDPGKLATEGTLGEDIIADQEEKQARLLANQKSFNEQAAALAADFVTDTVMVFAEGIGDMLSGDANLEDFGKALLKAVGGFLANLGKMMIQFGATALVYSVLAKALSNPVTAGPAAIGMIAAGAALVAIGGAISGAAGNGGSGAGGGPITTIDTRGSGTGGGGAGGRNSLNPSQGQNVQVEVVGRIDNKTIALSNAQGQKDLRR